ncbi:MAG TPA: ABC transporter permease, partial [Verrucomicrobiae bacterium]|nr:ABC transporter permease [Verrucomicrobiae bacterium]
MSVGTFLGAAAQDVRFASRLLRRQIGATLITVLTLAIAIGANTAIFSIMDGLLLRGLPVKDPRHLMLLKWSAHKRPNYHHSSTYGDCVTRFRGDNPSGCSFSLPFYEDLRDHNTSFSSLAAFGGGLQLNVSGNGQASIAGGLLVSGNYFSTLGIAAALGRTLQPNDDSPSAPPVAVLSYAYWLHDFSGSPAVIGKTVGLNGVPTVIVGVAARSFTSLTPGNIYQVFLPISMRAAISPRWNPAQNDAGSAWLVIVGRPKPGVPAERAQAEVDTLFRRALAAGPKPLSKPGDGAAATLASAQSALAGARRQFTQPLTIMMLAVGVILLIACANIGGLQLARAISREKEMALRIALGGAQARILRQLLTESLLVATLGGIVGLAFAWLGSRAILAMVAGASTSPTGLTGDVDLRVLLFTAGISLVSGILFGLAPAARGMRMDLNRSLRDGAGNAASRGRVRSIGLGQALAISQIALCVVILTGAGLLVRTLRNLRSVDPGFDTNNILLFSINPTLIGYHTAAVDALNRQLQERLARLPGVTAVSFAQNALLAGSLSSTTFEFPSRPGVAADSNWLTVGTGYFETLRAPLLGGRDFTQADSAAAAASEPAVPGGPPPAGAPPTPVIVNQTFVKRYFNGASPLGRHFNYKQSPGDPPTPGFVVIGVAPDIKYNSLRDEIAPTTYAPAIGSGVNFALRTAGSPTALIGAVRAAVRQTDPNLPIVGISTQAETIDRLLAQERIVAQLAGFIGLLALLLACTGLFGLLSHEVGTRTREIGIRMALGARSADVLRLVLGTGLVVATLGLALGAAAAFGVTRCLK